MYFVALRLVSLPVLFFFLLCFFYFDIGRFRFVVTNVVAIALPPQVSTPVGYKLHVCYNLYAFACARMANCSMCDILLTVDANEMPEMLQLDAVTRLYCSKMTMVVLEWVLPLQVGLYGKGVCL